MPERPHKTPRPDLSRYLPELSGLMDDPARQPADQTTGPTDDQWAEFDAFKEEQRLRNAMFSDKPLEFGDKKHDPKTPQAVGRTAIEPIFKPKAGSPFTALEKIQSKFGEELVRTGLIDHIDEESSDASIKKAKYDLVRKHRDGFLSLLFSDEVQEDLAQLKLGKEGVILIHDFLTDEELPEFEKLLLVKKAVDAKVDPSAIKDRISSEVFELTRPETWLLDDEQRAWYNRVADAPSLQTEPPEYKGPFEPKTRGRLMRIVTGQSEVPRKNYPGKTVSTFSSLAFREPTEDHSEKFFQYQPERFLTPDEVQKLIQEMYRNNPRKANTHYGSLEKPPASAVLAFAKREAMARLDLDRQFRQQ